MSKLFDQVVFVQVSLMKSSTSSLPLSFMQDDADITSNIGISLITFVTLTRGSFGIPLPSPLTITTLNILSIHYLYRFHWLLLIAFISSLFSLILSTPNCSSLYFLKLFLSFLVSPNIHLSIFILLHYLLFLLSFYIVS